MPTTTQNIITSCNCFEDVTFIGPDCNGSMTSPLCDQLLINFPLPLSLVAVVLRKLWSVLWSTISWLPALNYDDPEVDNWAKHRVTIPCKRSFDFTWNPPDFTMKSGGFQVKSTQNLINSDVSAKTLQFGGVHGGGYDPRFHEIKGHSPSPAFIKLNSFCWNIWIYKVLDRITSSDPIY